MKITTNPVERIDLPFTGASRLAAGPDGNLWITVPARRAIARFSPDGSSTEFTLPMPLSLPLSIAAGPDGNLWFSEPDNGTVGRITPQGAVREFAIGVLPRAPLPQPPTRASSRTTDAAPIRETDRAPGDGVSHAVPNDRRFQSADDSTALHVFLEGA